MKLLYLVLGLFKTNRNRLYEKYLSVYTAIVKQARTTSLYGDGMAPDSFDGRFDMLVLHVYLMLKRLKKDGPARGGAGQVIFDLFFQDMDQVLREMGVGDLGVGKKVKKMAEAFYGRVHAYDTAFEQNDEAVLLATLARNFYPSSPECLKLDMASYAHALDAYLDGVESEKILTRDVFNGFMWGLS